MIVFVIIIIFFIHQPAYCQQWEDEVNDQQLEELSESEETEQEDEFTQQEMMSLRRHPINLNDENLSDRDIPFLNSLQVVNLLTYRRMLGNFISVFELQAVPGLTVDIIRKLLPYVTIEAPTNIFTNLNDRLSGGEEDFISRPGNGGKLFFRYKYQKGRLLQFGALGERDAGEKSLVDFYSFHFFLRQLGAVRTLALGDYCVNLGQGLIHWQSQAFRKSAAVLNVKRQSEILKPYHSAGEFNFQRGAAITVKWNKLQATAFISYRKLTTNQQIDPYRGTVITSIITSGLHRSAAELERKNNASLFSMGGNMSWQMKKGHIGINAVQYHYSRPVLRRSEFYNLFSLRGNSLGNVSIDYSYTRNNMHFFGEMAAASTGGLALLHGAMASVHAAIDLTLLYRAISPRYQSLYGNAFTENSLPSNENGLYFGIAVKPTPAWRIDFYADVFAFPWLKYRVDAPSYGSQHLFQITWKPTRTVELYSRLRFRSKPLNLLYAANNAWESHIQENWRTHFSVQLTRTLTLRARVENCWFRISPLNAAETGYLAYVDIVYKPLNQWLSGSCRVQFFDCDSYETRIYAFENGLLFTNSIPAYYQSGVRTYLNLRAKRIVEKFFGIQVDLGLKLGITAYSSSVYTINNSRFSDQLELRFQALFSRPGKKNLQKSKNLLTFAAKTDQNLSLK